MGFASRAKLEREREREREREIFSQNSHEETRFIAILSVPKGKGELNEVLCLDLENVAFES